MNVSGTSRAASKYSSIVNGKPKASAIGDGAKQIGPAPVGRMLHVNPTSGSFVWSAEHKRWLAAEQSVSPLVV